MVFDRLCGYIFSFRVEVSAVGAPLDGCEGSDDGFAGSGDDVSDGDHGHDVGGSEAVVLHDGRDDGATRVIVFRACFDVAVICVFSDGICV